MSAQTTSHLSSVTASENTPNDAQVAPGEPLPTATQEAIDFIDSLEEHDFKFLVFEDNLITISDTGKELGEFKVTISPAKHIDEECYLVHANSHGSIDGVPCGTSITGYVSRSLETLEQQHHEYVKLENHPLDRKTFIVRQNQGYVINRVVTQGEDVQRSAHTYTLKDMEGFISEGSNLLLQRLLVKKGLPANVQFVSFDSNSQLCPALYRPLEKRTQIVNETELDVTGIERTINSKSDLPTTWQSYFTLDGHLTSRVQVGSSVTMRLVTVPQVIEDDDDGEKPTFPKKPLNFEEDMQMYSNFLQRKEELKNDHSVYLRQHPELRALLADFTQFLLLRKPTDILEFAADYFSAFSDTMPTHTAYMESAAQTPFPGSRSNSKIQFLSRTNTGV